MQWDVVEVTPERDWVLFVRFADGLSGRVRFERDYFRGAFAPLRDPHAFQQVYIDHGAVAWPGEIDLAPDAMYHEIRSTGEWILAGPVRDSVA